MAHMRQQMGPAAGATSPYGYSGQMGNQSPYSMQQSSPNFPMASNHQNGSSLERLEKVKLLTGVVGFAAGWCVV